MYTVSLIYLERGLYLENTLLLLSLPFSHIVLKTYWIQCNDFKQKKVDFTITYNQVITNKRNNCVISIGSGLVKNVYH